MYRMAAWSIGLLTLVPYSAMTEEQRTEPLVLEKMGVMFIGGKKVEMPPGGRFGRGGKQTQIARQAPVHFLVPPADKRRGKLPIVMVPGMGLTSYLYLGTPDGRDGWAQIFAKAGHPVYVFDEPNNAISGFEVGKFNDVGSGRVEPSQLPRIMLWANEMTWRRWGIGPEYGVPAKNTRFPVKHIEQLYASMTPVIGGAGGRGGRGGRGRGGRGGRGRGGREGVVQSNPKVEALVKLLDKIGPATLVLHSASGPTGFEATRLRPNLVKGIVAVEVTGSPTDSEDIAKYFGDKRFVGVYGDNFDLRPMAGRHQASVRMAEEITKAGGKGEVLWLPKMGIEGNSHLLMQDNNNDDIARMIMKRLGK